MPPYVQVECLHVVGWTHFSLAAHSCAVALLAVSPLHCLVVLWRWLGVVLHAKLFSHQRGPAVPRWQFRTGGGLLHHWLFRTGGGLLSHWLFRRSVAAVAWVV
jgi:hypothetical protein